MFTVVHGDDFVKTLKYIDSEVEKNSYTRFSQSADILLDNISTLGLFNESKRKYIINCSVTDITSAEFQKLKPFESKCDLIFYYIGGVPNKELLDIASKKVVNQLSKDSAIFKFLDSLLAKDFTQSYKHLIGFFNDDAEIYVITMINFMMKNIAKFHYQKQEFEKLNPYVKSKMLNFMDNYKPTKFKNCYLALADLDYKIKSGYPKKEILTSLVYFYCL